MIKIIRNAEVYSPEYIGKKDILILDNKIAKIAEDIKIEMNGFVEVEEIEGSGFYAVPGFIDCHVHILGGGGEGSFKTRTPEAKLTTLTSAGVTTVVGILGTDGVGRDMQALLSKAYGLEEEGVSTYIYTGSYRLPIRSLTRSLMSDIMSVEKIIGIGEIALSDHRSSQPSFEEFVKVVADTRVAGMLSGKAGICNIHMGDGKRGLEFLKRIVEETEIPITQFLPTHINRNPYLFEEGIEFAKNGGFIDFTASDNPKLWEEMYEEVPFAKGVKRLLEAGVEKDRFTMSSDGQGSLPIFDDKGEYVGIGIGKSSSLIRGIKRAVFEEKLPLEIVLPAITSNPAKALKFKNKGRLAEGFDGDLCLLDKELNVHTVLAKGQTMVKDYKPVVFGTFDNI